MSKKSSMKGFNSINIVDGLIKLTFTKNGLLFSKSALASLHNAPYIDLFVNSDKSKLMMKKSDKPNEMSLALQRKSNHQANIRINHKKLNSMLTEWLGADTDKHNYKISGRYLRSNDAVIFDLDKATVK